MNNEIYKTVKSSKQNNICKFCDKNKELIKKSHIIPKGFYTGENYILKDLSSGETKRRPCGSYAPNILCSDCDNHVFGVYDNYATKIFLKTNYTNYIIEQNKDYILYYFKKDEFDYNKLRIFIISVLWRASVSNTPEFKDFSLGYYENIAKDIIKNKTEYEDLFKIQIFRLPNGRIGSDVFKIFKINNTDSYKLYMANYVISITINGKNLSFDTKNIQEKMFNKDNLCILESEEIYEIELHNLKRAVTDFEKIKKY